MRYATTLILLFLKGSANFQNIFLTFANISLTTKYTVSWHGRTSTVYAQLRFSFWTLQKQHFQSFAYRTSSRAKFLGSVMSSVRFWNSFRIDYWISSNVHTSTSASMNISWHCQCLNIQCRIKDRNIASRTPSVRLWIFPTIVSKRE